MSDVKIVEKSLRCLTNNFNFVVSSIEESKDIDQLIVDELQSSLLVHDKNLERKGMNNKFCNLHMVKILFVEEEETIIKEEVWGEEEADHLSTEALSFVFGVKNKDIISLNVQI